MLENLNKYFKVNDRYFMIECKEITDKKTSCIENKIVWEVFDTKCMYIRIKSFTTDSFKADIYDVLYRAHQYVIERIAFDLRENYGGDLDNALYLLGCLGATGKIEFTKNVHDINLEKYGGVISLDLQKIVVIVNRNTISAAELVTIALKQLKNTWILGETTYGKSEIQDHIIINNKYRLKITVGRFIVNNIDISSIGVVPDIYCLNCKKEIYNLYNYILSGNANFADFVMFVQIALKEINKYERNITGVYDFETIKAVKTYKEDKGILADDFITKTIIDELYRDLNMKRDRQKEEAMVFLKK